MGARFIWLKDLPLSSQLLNIHNFIYLQFWQKRWKYFPLVWFGMKDEQGWLGGWVLKWPWLHRSQVSGDMPCVCPRMVKVTPRSSSFLPLTLIVVSLISLQCMIHVMEEGGQARGCRASGGFGVTSDWARAALGSDHGTVWSLHLEELDDEGGAPRDNLGRQVAEGTVLDAHDGQLAAEGQLKREAVQVGVVVEVQLLQVLQCAWGQTTGSVSLNKSWGWRNRHE